MVKKLLVSIWGIILFACAHGVALAHPHVFVNAKLVIQSDESGRIERLQQIWDFDPLFSSAVILDFDMNGNHILDPEERAEVGLVIKDSLADYNYFQSIKHDGKDVTVQRPDEIKVEWNGRNLQLIFDVKPAEAVQFKAGNHYQFSLYDPTFYVAVDFKDAQDFTIEHLPQNCQTRFIRPDADNVLTQSLAQQSEDFFEDPSRSYDFAWSLATHLEVTCR